jgi:diadenosine tetraphosphate (Ap4A) HIT family hydrolase
MYKLDKKGCRIITNHGIDGRQEVPHLHFHFLGGQDIGKMINI